MRLRFGVGELAVLRFELRRLVPSAALERNARGHCRERVGTRAYRRRESLDIARFLEDPAGIRVLSELQIGIHGVIHRMERVVWLLRLLRRSGRALVDLGGILPC